MMAGRDAVYYDPDQDLLGVAVSGAWIVDLGTRRVAISSYGTEDTAGRELAEQIAEWKS